jgi:protein-S-isoprenylcysteine O-methyltransferase Ste14
MTARHFPNRMNQKTSHILSIAATVILIAAMICLYWLDALFSTAPPVIAVQIMAMLLMAWARLTFGRRSFYFAAAPTSQKLITHGAYKLIRHPIYAAIWLFSWAGVAAHLSVISGILAVVVLASLTVRILCEESCLRREFADYPAYTKRTARLIPFIL